MNLTPVREINEVYTDLAATREGEGGALREELIRSLRPFAYAICWDKLRDRRPDIVNYAVWQALNKIESFRGEAKFATWFRHIVENLCMSILRQQAQRNEQPLEDVGEELLADEAPSDAHIELAELTVGLEPDEIELLRMKLEGHAEGEIGEQLGLTTAGVRTRFFRLRQKIQERINGQT